MLWYFAFLYIYIYIYIYWLLDSIWVTHPLSESSVCTIATKPEVIKQKVCLTMYNSKITSGFVAIVHTDESLKWWVTHAWSPVAAQRVAQYTVVSVSVVSVYAGHLVLMLPRDRMYRIESNIYIYIVYCINMH